jgi:type II secretory pathway pseudopilin PulG
MKAMRNIINRTKAIGKVPAPEGFSLIEATIALTTLGICLAYAMPLFLYSKMNNIKSEVRMGSMMVSQQIFDDLRGIPFQNIAAQSSTTSPDGAVISSSGATVVASSTSIPKDSYKVMGRVYKAKFFYCEVVTGIPNECNSNYQKIRVEVLDRNDKVVYEMTAGFTNFR